jgi:hypothetical protein
MRLLEAILATVAALSLAGCLVHGKQQMAKAVPPPPQPAPQPAPQPLSQPLSIPQTNVILPPPQPVNPEAVAAATAPEKPVEAAPAPPSPRRTSGAPQGSPRQETPAVVGPPSPPASDRPPVEEIVPADEQKRLQESAENRKKAARQLLDQMKGRHATQDQHRIIQRVQSFLNQSDEAAQRGDMRQADLLAERALVLAKELPVAK